MDNNDVIFSIIPLVTTLVSLLCMQSTWFAQQFVNHIHLDPATNKKIKI